MQGSLPLDFSRCQRWRDGRDRYRPAGEVFDHRHATVERIDTATAKAFVTRHHYAHSFPAARLNVGLFVKRPFQKETLSGVATFSVPMTQAVIPALLDGLPASQGVELGRFVLLDEIEANGDCRGYWIDTSLHYTAGERSDAFRRSGRLQGGQTASLENNNYGEATRL